MQPVVYKSKLAVQFDDLAHAFFVRFADAAQFQATSNMVVLLVVEVGLHQTDSVGLRFFQCRGAAALCMISAYILPK